MSFTSAALPDGLQDEALVCRLHERAGAGRWRVSPARFAQALSGAVTSRFPGAAASRSVDVEAGVAHRGASTDTSGASTNTSGASINTSSASPDAAALERFLDSLHLEDLALAVGCAEGSEPAWEAFVSAHRGELRRAAAAIAGSDRADDLSDALLGELFGVDARGGARRSLFLYFHGRSRLSTWLRAILAQRHVDRLRAERRIVSLDAVERPDDVLPAQVAVAVDPDRGRLVGSLQRALDAALAGLDAHDRLRLVCYHVDGMTLAEMGRLFHEHEATASRKLTRIRGRVRETAEAFLQRECGLKAAQIRLCFEYALEQGGVELRVFGGSTEKLGGSAED